MMHGRGFFAVAAMIIVTTQAPGATDRQYFKGIIVSASADQVTVETEDMGTVTYEIGRNSGIRGTRPGTPAEVPTNELLKMSGPTTDNPDTLDIRRITVARHPAKMEEGIDGRKVTGYVVPGPDGQIRIRVLDKLYRVENPQEIKILVQDLIAPEALEPGWQVNGGADDFGESQRQIGYLITDLIPEKYHLIPIRTASQPAGSTRPSALAPADYSSRPSAPAPPRTALAAPRTVIEVRGLPLK